MDVTGEFLFYYFLMTNVFLADPHFEERSALKLMLKALKMEVIGEAGDWSTTLMKTPTLNLDMLLIDESILPSMNTFALKDLRALCPAAIIVVLVNSSHAGMQRADMDSVDVFVSKREMPDCLAQRLVTAAENLRKINYLDLSQVDK
jgi:DNA-binding NarL/FixJ family response regulator